MKRAIIPILVLFSLCAAAQSIPELTGTWTGLVKVPLSKDLIGELVLTQKGLLVDGYLKTKPIDEKDSTKYEVSGAIADGVLHLEGTKFIYNQLFACLAIMDLKFSNDGGMDKLTGKWGGDFRLSTCAPTLSGKIEFARVTQPVTEAPPVVAMERGDWEGNALLDELKNRKYYALIIGESEYADDKIVDLDNPVKDAVEFSHVLRDYYTFDAGNITLLTNPGRAEIVESFDALSKKITDKDQFLIFYAGHGVWDETLRQGYWLPSDARLNSKAQWLSNSTIRDYVGGIQSKHTLLITDACFSGGIFKERGVNFENSRAMMEMYRLPSRKAMTSGALKTVPDQSVFITYLIKNLTSNQQPLLSAEDLFRTFKIAVINNSPNGQVPQYGAIGQVGDEGGDFIFLRRNTE